MTTLSKEDVVVHPYWKSCTNKEEIIIALTANASAGDSGAAMRSDVTDAINRAIQLARADLVAENERLKEAAMFFSTYTDPDELEMDEIENAARESFRRANSGVRGTTITRANSYESHVIWATKARISRELTAPRTALAAAEADNERLRNALNEILTTDWVSDRVRRTAKTALAQPRDDSALREMIAGVYEECVKGCRKEAVVIVVDGPEERAYNNAISDCEQAIRALAEKAKGNNA